MKLERGWIITNIAEVESLWKSRGFGRLPHIDIHPDGLDGYEYKVCQDDGTIVDSGGARKFGFCIGKAKFHRAMWMAKKIWPGKQVWLATGNYPSPWRAEEAA